jgi:protein SCO1/2
MKHLFRTLMIVSLALAALLSSSFALAIPRTPQQGIPAGIPPELEGVGVTEHLNEPLPLDAQFTDESGKQVRLGDYWDGKRPVVFVFAYHSCPVVCSLVLNSVTTSLKQVGWTIGREYQVVTISIDPEESRDRSAAKKAALIKDYDRPGAEAGWHFLTGDNANIAKVTAGAGYRYRKDENGYAHPPVLMIAKPNGDLARYLYGLEFPPNDIKLGLLEASEGRSVSTVEQLILYCYHYDPKGGKYVIVATRVMQVGGGITGFIVVLGLAILWLRERRKGGLLSRDSGDKPVTASLAPEPNIP